MECPIKLDQVNCRECYFWRDGKCKYKLISDGFALDFLIGWISRLEEAEFEQLAKFTGFLSKARGGL